MLISWFAFLVALAALLWTTSAKAKLVLNAERHKVLLESGKPLDDGDEVSIFNIGRASAIIIGVRAITKDDKRLSAKIMSRGPDNDRVEFPDLPRVLEAHGVLSIWFSVALAGDQAGYDHGYEVTYRARSFWGTSPVRKKVVKSQRPSTPTTPPLVTEPDPHRPVV